MIYAGFLRRLGAVVIDTLVTLPVYYISFLFLNAALGQSFFYDELSLFISAPPTIVITALIFAGCEASSWQATPGKAVCGIITTDRNGRRLTFLKALLRNIIKQSELFFILLSLFTGALGALCLPPYMLFMLIVLLFALALCVMSRKRTLQDFASGSLVINKGALPLLREGKNPASPFKAHPYGVILGVILGLLFFSIFFWYLGTFTFVCI